MYGVGGSRCYRRILRQREAGQYVRVRGFVIHIQFHRDPNLTVLCVLLPVSSAYLMACYDPDTDEVS